MYKLILTISSTVLLSVYDMFEVDAKYLVYGLIVAMVFGVAAWIDSAGTTEDRE